MKKYKCIICGNIINLNNDKNITCEKCNTNYEYSFITKENKIKVLQKNIELLIINQEYNKANIYLDNTHNNILLEYYKVFVNRNLNKKYDDNKLFDFNYDYTNDELDVLLKHMIEHSYVFTNTEIEKLIQKSSNLDYYIMMLSNINNSKFDKTIKEKELREKLFNKVNIIKMDKEDNRKKDGVYISLFSVALLIIFFAFIALFGNINIKYELINISFIIPCIILTIGLSKVLMKKDNKYISILMFILLYYALTIPGFLMFDNIETNFFVDHFMGIIKSLFEIMMEYLGDIEDEIQ